MQTKLKGVILSTILSRMEKIISKNIFDGSKYFFPAT